MPQSKLSKMNYQELSEQYLVCCNEIQRLTTMLYDELHTDEGDPVTDWEQVIDKVNQYRQGIQAETNAIINICQDYNETPLNNERQKEV